MARSAARIGLLVASLALVFAVGEIALRVVAAFDREHITRLLEPPPARDSQDLRLLDLIRPDPDPLVVYTLRPGLRGRFKGVSVRINRLGMRGPEVTDRTPGSVRIVLLGDSHTFGWGVAWHDTFGARLAARLNERAAGRVVEVLNLGVPGYNAVQEVRTFERQLEALRPDFAVIHYVGNDSDLPNFLYSPPDVWALRPSLLIESVRGRIEALWRHGHRPMMLAHPPRNEYGSFRFPARSIPARYNHLQGLEPLYAAYDRLAELAREHSVPVALLLDANDYSSLLAGREHDLHGSVASELVSRWGAHGQVVVDTQEALLAELRATAETSEALWLGPDDPHPNPRRHARIAEILAAQLGDVLLSPAGEGDDLVRREKVGLADRDQPNRDGPR